VGFTGRLITKGLIQPMPLEVGVWLDTLRTVRPTVVHCSRQLLRLRSCQLVCVKEATLNEPCELLQFIGERG